MNVFKSLSPDIQAILAKKGLDSPTAPQQKAIPSILAGKNVLLIAPTGMGKTEAAVLPLLHMILEAPNERGIKAIYITPLRALNRDMLLRLLWFGEQLGVDVAVRHGDTTQAERSRQSRNPPDLLITTPETLQIMFTGKILRKHLQKVRWVVVDEVHELATSERGIQLALGLERLVYLTRSNYQRIGLSATVGSPDVVGQFLVGSNREVSIIRVPVGKSMSISIESPQSDPEDEELAVKLRAEPQTVACIKRMRQCVDEHRSTLLFVNTRDTAEGLAARFGLWDPEFPIGVHHGSLSKEVRVQMEDDFKAEKLKGLLCTSSLELGIDVGSADFTVQYISPRSVSRLVQRIGRAGHRLGETSQGVIIAQNPDDIAESAVIARKALDEELEPIEVRQGSLSVLANQMVSHTMMDPDVQEDFFLKVVKSAYPFRNLTEKDFDDVVQMLGTERILWLEKGRFKRRRNSTKYFYDNISMIPDQRNFKVRNIATRGMIGTLDEAFVISSVHQGAKLIIKGASWSVVDIEDDEILVEPASEIGAVPSWLGEDIPVPHEVAMEVGKVRRTLDLSKYPVSDEAGNRLQNYLNSQTDSGFSMPTDRLVVVEAIDKNIIVNACFGTKVNETLGRYLSAMMAARLGQSVGLRVDPYRILLTLPSRGNAVNVVTLLKEAEPESLEGMLRVVLKNSTHLRWELVQVARKFGAIKKDVDWRKVPFARLFDALEGTVIFEETLKKVLWEKLDIDTSKDMLYKLKSGKIKMETSSGRLSPIGKAGLDAHRELMMPQQADGVVLQAMKKRLEKERVRKLCLSCKATMGADVKELPASNIRCHNCDGSMQAVLHPASWRERARLLEKAKPTASDKKEIRKLYKNASLVNSFGKEAVLCLVARGVGEENAGRILDMIYTSEEEFLRAILKAEVQFARTKRFWR